MATLTTTQKAIIAADIAAQLDLVGQPDTVVAGLYNAPAAPTFWGWRTAVSRSDVYTKQNDLATDAQQTGFWRWDVFKAQNATEQTAWIQMFMGDVVNFAAANVRAGIASIFSGSASQAAQQAHCLAIGRRTATRIEKLLATGTGSTASPAVFGFEGNITAQQVSDILAGI